MKILIIIAVVVIVAGLFFWRTLSLKPEKVVEQKSLEIAKEEMLKVPMPVTKKGNFIKVDVVHKAEGEVKVFETKTGPVLQFSNFKVTAGPDLFVYLTENADLAGLKPDLGKFISLGKLQASSGEQFYTLPNDWQQYKSVVIWCRLFGIHFSSAKLL